MKTKFIIPNLLSLSRFPTAYLILYCVLRDFWIVAFFLVVWGFASDVVDGYIARKWNVMTVWGNIIDLISDIFLDIAIISGALIKDLIPLSLTIPLILILVLMRVHGLIGRPLPSKSPWGKVAAWLVLVYSPSMLAIFAAVYTFRAFGTMGILVMIVAGILAGMFICVIEGNQLEEWAKDWLKQLLS